MRKTREEISPVQYSKHMSNIIDKGLPVAETLIELLDEAEKFKTHPELLKAIIRGERSIFVDLLTTSRAKKSSDIRIVVGR